MAKQQAKQQQEQKPKVVKEFVCRPVRCDRRRIWQRQWYVRDYIEAKEGKQAVQAPWKSCNYIVDEDYAQVQADRLRKRGHIVTFEPIPDKKAA